jgi:hypothetical protein
MALTDYSKADLAALTPEELSALETDDGDADGHLKAIAEEADEPAAGEAAAAGAATADPAAAASAAAATGTETPAAGAADPAAVAASAAAAPAATPTTTYKVDPGDAEKTIAEQKAAVKAEKTKELEALQKLNDGEITFEDYSAIRADVETAVEAATEKIDAAKNLIQRAQISREMSEQQIASAWTGEVSAALSDLAKAGIDCKAKPELMAELNALVRAYGDQAATNGLSDENGLAASKWALAQAQKVMQLQHGKPAAAGPGAAGATAAAAATAGAAAAAAAPAAARHGLTTLGGLPGADRSQVESDLLAKVGTLQGEELEVFLASQPKDVVERLMASV